MVHITARWSPRQYRQLTPPGFQRQSRGTMHGAHGTQCSAHLPQRHTRRLRSACQCARDDTSCVAFPVRDAVFPWIATVTQEETASIEGVGYVYTGSLPVRVRVSAVRVACLTGRGVCVWALNPSLWHTRCKDMACLTGGRGSAYPRRPPTAQASSSSSSSALPRECFQ